MELKGKVKGYTVAPHVVAYVRQERSEELVRELGVAAAWALERSALEGLWAAVAKVGRENIERFVAHYDIALTVETEEFLWVDATIQVNDLPFDFTYNLQAMRGDGDGFTTEYGLYVQLSPEEMAVFASAMKERTFLVFYGQRGYQRVPLSSIEITESKK